MQTHIEENTLNEILFLNSLLATFNKHELYNALLITAEYTYLKFKQTESIYFILKALQKLNYNERIISFCKENIDLLEYYEINLIFLSSLSKLKKEIDEDIKTDEILPKPTKNLLFDTFIENDFNLDSLHLLYKGLTSKEEIRKKNLLEAFLLENQNMEALYCLKIEKLLTNREFTDLLMKIKDLRIQDLLFNIFVDKKDFDKVFNKKENKWLGSFHYFGIISMFELSKYYFRKEYRKLFPLGVFMIENYPTCSFSYFILGLYYHQSRNLKEAKKCFYKSVQINDKIGISWLLLGNTYSKLKECENAILCYKSALNLMIGSYKPLLYLAIENNNINDLKKANSYFLMAMHKKANKKTCFYAAVFFIFNDKLPELEETIKKLKITNKTENDNLIFNYILFFYNIKKENYKEAEQSLKICPNDYRFKVCRGFLFHLQKNYKNAIKYYNQSMIENVSNSVIASLVGSAIDPSSDNDKYVLLDQIYEIFDYIKLIDEIDLCIV
ncbi:hypothetical protein GVAV_002060 [Gurleya vavrai]